VVLSLFVSGLGLGQTYSASDSLRILALQEQRERSNEVLLLSIGAGTNLLASTLVDDEGLALELQISSLVELITAGVVFARPGRAESSWRELERQPNFSPLQAELALLDLAQQERRSRLISAATSIALSGYYAYQYAETEESIAAFNILVMGGLGLSRLLIPSAAEYHVQWNRLPTVAIEPSIWFSAPGKVAMGMSASASF
jgi:hypothetical protein